MNNSQELQPADSDIEVLEEDISSSPSTPQMPQHISNVQNNFHFAQKIDLDKMAQLNDSAPDLASRVMTLYENQFDHAKTVDNNIITLEKNEQTSRINERPFQRKFAFRSLNYAFSLSIAALGFAAYFATIEAYTLAGLSITVPISVAVANMLGYKSASQDKNEDKDKES